MSGGHLAESALRSFSVVLDEFKCTGHGVARDLCATRHRPPGTRAKSTPYPVSHSSSLPADRGHAACPTVFRWDPYRDDDAAGNGSEIFNSLVSLERPGGLEFASQEGPGPTRPRWTRSWPNMRSSRAGATC